MSEAEFLKTIAANVEALNAATATSRPRRCGCTSAGATTKARTTSTSRSKDHRRVLAARPATILFEAANPRHEHEWVVWKAADTTGKVLAPGWSIRARTTRDPELIAQRIERFASFVGKERVVASSDCGFGTFAGYGKIDPAVAWKKLAALREGADIADGRIA
jgi:5-methyltetrahydropteroyltriglutamate--homocysteine methyltransferase